MKEIFCPSCDFNNQTKINNYKKFEIYKCNKCELIFCFPFKNPGAEFYENLHNSIDRHNPYRFNKINASQKLFFKRNKTTGKIMDIACGMGTFLNAARNKKFDTYGLDFDNEAINICKNFFHLLNVSNKDISELTNEPNRFDYISLIDVLEHIDNPKDLLFNIKELLNEKGLLIISLPNYNRYPNYTEESGDNPPHHLTKWTTISLKNILENCGFEVVYCKPLKFTGYDLVDFLRVKFYTNFINKIKRINIQKDVSDSIEKKATQEKNDFKSSITKKILFKIRDFIIFSLAMLLYPINFIIVKIFKFESDHIYAEARKK